MKEISNLIIQHLGDSNLKPEISTKRKYKSFARTLEHMDIPRTKSSNQHAPSKNLEWVQRKLMEFDEETWQSNEMKKKGWI